MSKQGDTRDAGQADELGPRKQSAGQQFLIWFLVIMVGVLFGMGPAVALIRGPGPGESLGVSDTVAMRYVEIDRKLSSILGRRQSADKGEAVRVIRVSRLAASEGLLPKGDALDAIVADFLSEKAMGGRSIGAVLSDYVGSDREVKSGDLEWYLQAQAGYSNFLQRRILVPALPEGATRPLLRAYRDQVEFDEVVLSTAALAEQYREAAAADELEIETEYAQLRDRWFQIPAKRSLTAFVIDADRIADLIKIPEDDIGPWYEANRAGHPEWLAPEPEAEEVEEEDEKAEGDEGGAASAEDAEADTEDGEQEDEGPRYLPLAEVREAVVSAMRRERALPLVHELTVAFEHGVQGLVTDAGGGDAAIPLESLIAVAEATTLDPADYPQLTAPATVRVVTDLTLEADQRAGPAGKGIAIPELGPEFDSVRFAAQPFSDDTPVGMVELPGSLPDGVSLVTRYGELTPSSYQPLEEVRGQVITYRAAYAAWDELLTASRNLAQRAEDHEEGLSGLFADEDLRSRYGIDAVDTETTRAMTTFTPPPEQPGQVDPVTGEPTPLLVLATDQRPVRLASVPPLADPDSLMDVLPKVRLIQVIDYQPAEDLPMSRGMDFYREAVQQYKQYRTLEEIDARISGN